METKGFEPSTSRMRTERSRKRYSKLPLRDVKSALFQGFAGHRDMTRQPKSLVNSTSSLGGDSDAAHLSHPPFFVLGAARLHAPELRPRLPNIADPAELQDVHIILFRSKAVKNLFPLRRCPLCSVDFSFITTETAESSYRLPKL